VRPMSNLAVLMERKEFSLVANIDNDVVAMAKLTVPSLSQSRLATVVDAAVALAFCKQSTFASHQHGDADAGGRQRGHCLQQ
jgi:hypothetical protein